MTDRNSRSLDARRWSITAVALASAVVLLGAGAAEAALTTNPCLALKRIAWGNLRKCQAGAEAKLLKGKPADLPICQDKLRAKLVKIDAKATKATIQCRFGANDGTVTDYDTGLEWERKEGVVGGDCPLFVGRVNRCVNVAYSLEDAFDFLGLLNGTTTDGIVTNAFIGRADWRLPTIAEVLTIVDLTVPSCSDIFVGVPCIHSIFAPTHTAPYWTGTLYTSDVAVAWSLDFIGGALSVEGPASVRRVRAVRTAL